LVEVVAGAVVGGTVTVVATCGAVVAGIVVRGIVVDEYPAERFRLNVVVEVGRAEPSAVSDDLWVHPASATDATASDTAMSFAVRRRSARAAAVDWGD